jgi:glutamate synthase (NADPH/NADH) small chain
VADDNVRSRNSLSFDGPDDSFNPCEAITEAKRCLNCKKPLCRTGCPIEHEIPQFIEALARGNVGEASTIIARRSNLPAVCGRVCPHEKQCEGACILAKKDQGIRIGKLEQFIADFDAEMELTTYTPPNKFAGKVAVIGSGPAGLTVAGDLAKTGYQVTVFESQTEPGGVLVYGIPDFRLKKDVVRREIRRIERLGVTFNTEVLVGPDITVDEMFAEGYNAIFIGTGTALPRTLDVPGKDLPGVLQASYLLQMVALARAGNVDRREVPIQLGDQIFVIGAGNVAMDAARTAIRLGAKATVVYHRTEKEITALPSEYQQAKEEGVQFIWLASTKQFLGQDKLTCLEYEALEIDTDKNIRGSGRFIKAPADKVILAIGQRPAARIISTTTGIEVNDKGYVITKDRPYGLTTRRGVFAGGDVVHEPATVVLAMKEAKKVAQGIALYIEAKKLLEECGE